MRIHRSVPSFAGLLGAALLWGVGPGATVAASQTGGACQLQGVANLSPPLSTSPASFAYSFSGTLSGCQSNVAGAPMAGTVSAGVQVPETVTLTNTSTGATSTGTVLYQQPIPQGSGSCGSSTTAGVAFAAWGDGRTTVIDYTTTGALAAVQLEGTVVVSVALALVPSSVPAGYTAPATYTISTDEPAFPVGEQSLALLTFSPTTTDQNCETVPVSSANIDGVVAIGSGS